MQKKFHFASVMMSIIKCKAETYLNTYVIIVNFLEVPHPLWTLAIIREIRALLLRAAIRGLVKPLPQLSRPKIFLLPGARYPYF